jgi:orotidine-5'-phosphate decarboxylase
VVVGATVPQKIAEVKQILQGKIDVYSPGVGAQGGVAEKAIKSGTKYLIVGREITNSVNPEMAVRRLSDVIKEI